MLAEERDYTRFNQSKNPTHRVADLFEKSAKLTKNCGKEQNRLSFFRINKTGLQPVSRPVERVLGFFPKGFKKWSLSKSLNVEPWTTFLKKKLMLWMREPPTGLF